MSICGVFRLVFGHFWSIFCGFRLISGHFQLISDRHFMLIFGRFPVEFRWLSVDLRSLLFNFRWFPETLGDFWLISVDFRFTSRFFPVTSVRYLRRSRKSQMSTVAAVNGTRYINRRVAAINCRRDTVLHIVIGPRWWTLNVSFNTREMAHLVKLVHGK